MRFEGEEQPVVLAIKLPDELLNKVKPDVGAASMLLIEDNNYLSDLADIYKTHGYQMPTIDPIKADRLDYLNKLGMAYINQDIDAQYLETL